MKVEVFPKAMLLCDGKTSSVLEICRGISSEARDTKIISLLILPHDYSSQSRDVESSYTQAQ